MRVEQTIVALLLVVAGAWAQQPQDAPLPTPKAVAPIDLTGYWVSIVPEDRFHMIAPPKGDFPGIPLNADGMKLANAWDPDKDEASGEQCKSYGAAAIMSVPGRFHITWDKKATVIEYHDLVSERVGNVILVINTILDDPIYFD
jgi:hypothetical protein